MKLNWILPLLTCASALSAQDLDFGDLEKRLANLQSPAFDANIAALAAQASVLAQSFGPEHAGGAHDDHDYQAGTSDLDAKRFDSAIRHFDAVIARKGARSDGALYWKAYAQNRSGSRAEALATLAVLRREFPASRWLHDAQALDLEIRANQGHPVSPAAEDNEELKLIAINGLMESDSSKAIPILKNLLNSNQPPGIKDRALFVLSQSSSPEARGLLLDLARGHSDPDLQSKAIRYISMMGGRESQAELAKIYASINDVNVKREIIRGYLLSGSKEQLLAAARGERDAGLRGEAIRTLAQTGGKEELWTLFQSESNPDLKLEIVRAMLLDGDSEHLLQIARTEKDLSLRKAAIATLGLTGWGKDSGVVVDLYRRESDETVKRELIRSLFLQNNAKGLVELARQEKNPELRRDIVQQLSLMHSKEATDYMLELLK